MEFFPGDCRFPVGWVEDGSAVDDAPTRGCGRREPSRVGVRVDCRRTSAHRDVPVV